MVDMEGNRVMDTDSPVHSVTGLVSHPETTRSSREYLATYVNGRYVTAGALRDAVLDAYGGQPHPIGILRGALRRGPRRATST